MKKFIKWTGIALGTLIVLVILALIIAPFFIDIQKFKPAIEQQVTKAVGRPFSIGGELKLSLFPLAGISFSDLHLGNPEGFEERDLLSIKSFDAKVKLLPLLSKDIQVRRFVIEGPRIVLEKTKDGKAGWQGLGSGAAMEEEENKQAASGLPIKGLNVAEFSLSEGELLYIDQASGTRKEVRDFRIELEDVSLEKPLRLSAYAVADGRPVSIEGEAGPIGKEPGKGAMTIDLAVRALDTLSMKLQGSITDAAIKPRFDLNLSVDNFSPRTIIKDLAPDFTLDTKDATVLTALSCRMKIKGSTESIEISDGALELDRSKMTFSVAAKDFAKPDISLSMNLDRIDADRYLPPAVEKKQTATARPATSPQKQEKTDYTLLRRLILDSDVNIGELTIKGAQVKDIQVAVKARDGIFNIDRLSMKAYEGSISGAAVMNVSGDIPAVQADIDVKGLQLRKAISGLLPDLKLNTRDPEVLKTLSAKIKMKGTTENISVSDGTVELDQSRIVFTAAAKDFSKPDLAFKMDLDKIDADRYLPPVVEENQAAAAQQPAVSQKEDKIDYGTMRNVVLDGALNIGEITVKGIRISNMQANVKAKNGVFNIAPFSLKAYEGGVAGSTAMDVSAETPSVKASADISKIRIRKLVNDLMKKDIIEGAATGNIILSMSGDSAALIKKTLNGKGEVRLKDGAIVGIDLTGMINNLKTAFGALQAAENTERTDFSEFIIPFDIKDGVITTQNTSLSSPALRVKAKGNADLTKDALDFRIEPTFVKTLKGQGDTKERSGITVPVLVKGTFMEPKFSPDLSGLAEKAIEKGIEKGVEKLIKDKTGESGKTDDTKDAVKGLLKGILGN